MNTVALFCTNFLPYSQTFVYEQIRQHVRYDVDVFTWRRQNEERFPCERVFVANPAYILTRFSPLFYRQLSRGGYSVVHAHFGPGGTYAVPYARAFRLPLVVTFHGYDVPLLTSPQRFRPIHLPYAVRARSMLRQMTLGLCASTELRDMLLSMGVPNEKLRVFRLGVDLTNFQAGERDPRSCHVIMIGRFVEKKGFEYGIRAFAAVLAMYPELRLTLVGTGMLEGELWSLVESLGCASRVEFAGELPPVGVAQKLQSADILLAPSVVTSSGDRESGLISVKEASASEVVPVGTRHGGIPEIIEDGVTGFLVPERDVEALASKLELLVKDRSLRLRMGKAARQRMLDQYDNRKRVSELEDIYDSLRRSTSAGVESIPSQRGRF